MLPHDLAAVSVGPATLVLAAASLSTVRGRTVGVLAVLGLPLIADHAAAKGLRVTLDAEALPRARLASEPADRSSVWFTTDGSHEVAPRVRAPQADRVVLADAYEPGWRATVDGRPVRVASEGPFRAVSVPAGEHDVTFTYAPPSYRLGLFISLLAVAAACGLVPAGRVRGAAPDTRRMRAP